MMKMKFLKSFMAMLLTVSAFLGVTQEQTNIEQEIEKIEIVLCPDGKPLGKPQSAATPDIRVVEVKDFSDALAYLLRMCPQRDIREEKKGGNFYYTYTLPDGENKLILTDKVKARAREVAVLEVTVESLKGKVKEVRFVKKV